MDKTFKNYDEMLELLRSRGIDLSTGELRGRAKVLLQHNGYYNLINGYKEPFLIHDEVGKPAIPEAYIPGTTVEDIYQLYSFDRNLRYSILQSTLYIETNIKSLISYAVSEVHGHQNYLLLQNFDTAQRDGISKVTALIADIQKQLASRTSDPSISHYLNSYGYVPLWVLNNILTFGQISKSYSLMLPAERVIVAKVLRVHDFELSNMLTLLTQVRNFCAHSNRLYCFRTKRPLLDLELHKSLGIERNVRTHEYLYGKRDFFAVMIVLKVLLPFRSFRALVNRIDGYFGIFSKNAILTEKDVRKQMGFPDDWKVLLLRQY